MFLWLVLFLLLLLIARQSSMLLKWKHLAFHCDLQVLVSNSSYSLLITVAEPLQIYSCCHVYESHWWLVHKAVKWGCHGLYEEVSIAPPPHQPNILSWSTMNMMTKSSSPAIKSLFYLCFIKWIIHLVSSTKCIHYRSKIWNNEYVF